MKRFLNVGVIQMPVNDDTVVNFEYIEDALDRIMKGHHRPELVVGVECCQMYTPEPIPGPSSDYFASLAKKYGIYFIPGSVYEYSEDLPEGKFYNSAPIYGPDGRLIDVYRKIAPWYPSEQFAAPGERCVVFDIPEKNTKVGVQICYDLNFPEISRTETLMGAEVLVKLTMDPQELFNLNKHLHYARALENQAYFVVTNGVGQCGAYQLYGHSQVITPEGNCLWEAEQVEAVATITLDLDLVSHCRNYGTLSMDHYLQQLRMSKVEVPFDDYSKAPVFEGMVAPVNTEDGYEEQRKEIGIGTLGSKNVYEPDLEAYAGRVKEFLEKKNI